MNSTAEHVGWVAEPTGRGTFGLLVSCATTVFLCTYNAVHLNLPGLEDSAWRIQERKIRYMLFCICAPEFFAFLAIKDFLCARELKKIYQIKDQGSDLPWTLKHYFFVLMGSFVIQTNQNQKKRIKAGDLLRLIEEDIVEFPAVEVEDIDDRSKASWVTKFFALIQISWFLTQLVARAVQELPVTTLELYTLSIVCCAVLTYGFNWHKPFDVQRPIVLQAKVSDYQWPMKKRRMRQLDIDYDLGTVQFLVTVLLVIMLFSSCHLIGWNFTFPSKAEQWLWRVGSLLCFVGPTAIALLMGSGFSGPRVDWALTILYFLVRIALFIEMFTNLRSAPAGVYQTPRWTNYFPSFGT